MAFWWLSDWAKKTPKKTPYSARNLPYPKITCRGAARRAQRHVPNSNLSTLRWIIAQTLDNSPLTMSLLLTDKTGKLICYFSDTVRLGAQQHATAFCLRCRVTAVDVL